MTNDTLNLQFDDFTPPSAEWLDRQMAFRKFYFNPVYSGFENINPDRPSLFVGNHAIYGMVDSPLVFNGIYQNTGVFVRTLGDHFHYKIPVWGKALIKFGSVPGTPENCDKLMQSGQHVMVFPGGGREVAKRAGEEHKLFWKQRTGFAKMAMKYGYDIIPFGSVGCDDAFKIIYDANQFSDSWLGKKLLKNKAFNDLSRNGDMFMPISRGIGLTSIPKPEKFYIGFGKPISTESYVDRYENKDAQWEVREQVADSINTLIADLQTEKAADTDKSWLRKLLIRA